MEGRKHKSDVNDARASRVLHLQTARRRHAAPARPLSCSPCSDLQTHSTFVQSVFAPPFSPGKQTMRRPSVRPKEERGRRAGITLRDAEIVCALRMVSPFHSRGKIFDSCQTCTAIRLPSSSSLLSPTPPTPSLPPLLPFLRLNSSRRAFNFFPLSSLPSRIYSPIRSKRAETAPPSLSPSLPLSGLKLSIVFFTCTALEKGE